MPAPNVEGRRKKIRRAYPEYVTPRPMPLSPEGIPEGMRPELMRRLREPHRDAKDTELAVKAKQASDLVQKSVAQQTQATQHLQKLMRQSNKQFLRNLRQLQKASVRGGRGGGLLRRKASRAGRAHVGNRNLWEWRGIKLAPGAMRTLIRASQKLGKPIVGGGYRSAETQRHLYATKPGLAAPPGRSLHEQGLAIDVDMNFLRANPRVVKILENLGWHRFDPNKEPWHFSYRRVG